MSTRDTRTPNWMRRCTGLLKGRLLLRRGLAEERRSTHGSSRARPHQERDLSRRAFRTGWPSSSERPLYLGTVPSCDPVTDRAPLAWARPPGPPGGGASPRLGGRCGGSSTRQPRDLPPPYERRTCRPLTASRTRRRSDHYPVSAGGGGARDPARRSILGRYALEIESEDDQGGRTGAPGLTTPGAIVSSHCDYFC
jgi:hypothetical protein